MLAMENVIVLHSNSKEGNMGILEIYKRSINFPLGRQFFNLAIGFRAPFFGKIRPNIVEMNPGLCVVKMNDRRSVRNHIGTINAGAMCTLTELTAGLAIDSAIQKNLRWLPRAMSVVYLKKGIGVLTAKCQIDPEIIKVGDVLIPLEIKDNKDNTVLTAEITFYISERKT